MLSTGGERRRKTVRLSVYCTYNTVCTEDMMPCGMSSKDDVIPFIFKRFHLV